MKTIKTLDQCVCEVTVSVREWGVKTLGFATIDLQQTEGITLHIGTCT